MKRDHLIRLNSELGKRIGLTSANFETAIVWDCRPKCLYFTLLIPNHPQETNVRMLFEQLQKIHTPVMFVCPTTIVAKTAKEFNYEVGIEPCGTTFVTNLRTKNLP